MVTDIITTADLARRHLYVVGTCIAQALAGTMTYSVEADRAGVTVHFSGGVAGFNSLAAADLLWRGLLAARRLDGWVVTEQGVGESAQDFRERHVAALLAAGKVQP